MTPSGGICYNSVMRNPEQRINIIIGQLEGVKRMLSRDDLNCFDSLIQLKAIRSSLSSLMDKILEDELDFCFTKQCPDSQKKLKKIFSEILKK